MADRLHFNFAGAGVPSAAVGDAVRAYLALEQDLGPYEAEAAHGETLVEAARASIARLLGATPDGIALFDNATRAWTTLVGNLPLRAGDVVWVSRYDYVGNLFFLTELRERVGIEVVVMPCTPEGDVDLDWVARNLTEDVALVSASHIPSCCGVVVDAPGLGRLLRGARALFVVDGCQAVGNIRIDVAEIGSDVYTGAGRKFLCGPRGTGFAHVSEKYLAAASPAVLDVHAMTVAPSLRTSRHVNTGAAFELAERNFALWAGFGVAVEEDLARDAEQVTRRLDLFDELERGVCALPGFRRLGAASSRAGIVSVTSDRVPVRALYADLLARGIRTWVGVGEHTPLFAPGEGADEFLRISLGRDSTPEEVDQLLHAFATLGAADGR